MKNKFFMLVLAVLILSLSGYIIIGLKYSVTYNNNLREIKDFPLSFIVAFHINNTFSICIMEESNMILEFPHIKGFFFEQKSYGETIIILKILTHNGQNNYFTLRKTQKVEITKVEITFHKNIKTFPYFTDVSFRPLIPNVILKKMFMYTKLKMIFAILCLFSSIYLAQSAVRVFFKKKQPLAEKTPKT